MAEIKQTICRSCTSFCHLNVTMENGRATKVTGDWESPVFKGFYCLKGRAMPELHDNPARLLHSLKRQDDGSYVPIESERALDEIAAKLSRDHRQSTVLKPSWAISAAARWSTRRSP